MRKSEAYPSNWLKSEENGMLSLPPRRPGDPPVNEATLIITSLDTHQFDDGKKQRVLGFKGLDCRLGLNLTNWDRIVELSGLEDDEDWIGLHITVYVTRVQYDQSGFNFHPPKLKSSSFTVILISALGPSTSFLQISQL